MLYVTGNPRSGTKSTSQMLRSYGWECPHEKRGRDGTVSCYWWIDGEQTEKDTVVHLVRHPLPCIASMVAIVDKHDQKAMVEYGMIPEGLKRKQKLLKMMYMYYLTNKWVSTAFSCYRVRLEFPVDWKVPLDMSTVPMYPKHLNKSSGFRKAEPLSWKDLKAQDLTLYALIRAQSAEYGYEASPPVLHSS